MYLYTSIYVRFAVFKAAHLQIIANFHENFENKIKWILYSNQKETFYTLSMALTTHVYYKKRSKYAKECSYCVSNAVEIYYT
jgi:hypothetical protein